MLHSEEQKRALHLFTAGTIDELCEKTGINAKNLKETILKYNSYASSEDSQFFKKHKYVKPFNGGRLYAAKHFPAGYGSLGGITVNSKLEVLTPEGAPIPGLYSCGTDACGIFGDSYCFYLPGSTMGFAINSGRIAGYEAVDYLSSEDFEE
jgi:fumarate reductase flavoprotein subunit